VRTATGTFPAAVVRIDPTNDIAILKVQGEFRALPVRGSRGLKLADHVATLGYPNPDLQGVASKYSSGEVAALSGPGDDPRFLQISVPIQTGNSGGPLVDTSGRVVGVVVSQLDKIATLKLTGNIPENVNYAIKGTILLGVMEAVPGLADKLQSEPAKPPKDAADVAKLLEAACGMVLVEK
jgi:S1-C subfamily serine protease